MPMCAVSPVSLVRAVGLAVVMVCMLGCAPAEERVTILAASSLQDVLPLILDDHHLSDAVRVSYAASSTLALQLEAGAPGDIFLSANTAWVDRLITAKVLQAASRIDPVGNQLVLVAPASRSATTFDADAVALLKSLGATQRLAIGDPAHVPAGQYARDTLRDLGLWDEFAVRCAFADNVRAALALVARGEAPLGIVYATDARLEDDVVVVARFDQVPQNITYSFALHQAAVPGAQTVFDVLTSSRAVARFTQAGFTAR